MIQNEEKINQFMEAIGEIDPKYIEEARQIVSSENTRRHPFSASILLASVRRWTHSPAARLVTAACLILVLAYGVRKTGFLSDFTLFGNSGEGTGSEELYSDSTDFNSWAAWSDENKTNVPESYKSSGKSDTEDNLSHDEAACTGTDSVNQQLEEKDTAAEKDKNGKEAEEASDDPSILTEPPMLTLHTNHETLRSGSGAEYTNFIDIQGNDYSWSYKQKNGNTSSSFGYGTDIWNLSKLPLFSIVSGNELTPDFNGTNPDSVFIRCIPSSEIKKADREKRYLEITPEKDGSFQIPEQEDSYVVEIQAVWDNDSYEGDCTYRFKVNFQS